MIVGTRLKELRQQSKMSLDELAEAIEISRQQLAKYESERTDIMSDTLVRLAGVFGVSTDYLLGRTDNPKKREKYGEAKFDIDRMIKVSPELAARMVKALRLTVQPDRIDIDVEDLLMKFPPAYVAEFIKQLGIHFEVKSASSISDSPESDED